MLQSLDILPNRKTNSNSKVLKGMPKHVLQQPTTVMQDSVALCSYGNLLMGQVLKGKVNNVHSRLLFHATGGVVWCATCMVHSILPAGTLRSCPL